MSESKYGICEECNRPNTHNWCNSCNAKRFQQNFKNWTSSNDNIDKFIQHTQLSANISSWGVLEWIPYNRFYDIEYIAKGGFGNVYKANWIDGYIRGWNNKNKNWKRGQNEFYALKSLNNSKNVTLEFINEITSHYKVSAYSDFIIRLYGITQDPETKNYMMVLEYAKDGSLRNYLNKNKNISWRDKIYYLHCIADGLNNIHEKDLIHQDLHIGNILENLDAYITDMGLCKPADYNNKLENTNNSVYGVLPYVAPEILTSQNSQNYTKASDIYSFGIIIYEVCSGLPPYYDISHDIGLAANICYGLRPRFNIKVPQLIVNLIKRCLDANPLNRPTADELEKILRKYYDELDVKTKQAEIVRQIKEADEINNNLVQNSNSSSPSTRLETHSEAIYTSRLLNFNNLPEPNNSDDYYKQNDNIISKDFLEFLKH